MASIGESFLNPRILEYALKVAPKGKEGVILAISNLPLILSIVVSGAIGGQMLNEYCPSSGKTDCWAVWLVVALVSIPAVAILIIFRKQIEDKPYEAYPFIPCSREAVDE